METRTQELNRVKKATTAIQRSHTRHIKFLDKEIEWVVFDHSRLLTVC